MGKDSATPAKKNLPNKRPQEQPPAPTDPRFAAAAWDPRFSRVPKKATKALQDQRFTSHLKSNPAFRQFSAPVDKFGRPKSNAARLNRSLREVAHLSDQSSSEDDHEPTASASASDLPTAIHAQDDTSDESELEEEQLEEQQLEDIPRGRATNRLAVLGLDWSTTRSVDIFACLSAFCPPGKGVQFVEIHPSKFGLERLAVEAKFGPQVVSKSDLQVVEDAKKQRLISGGDENGDDEELEGSQSEEESDMENDDDAKWRSQLALRKYEEDRLKYYYGVVQFEDVKAADAVYEQCDGVEYAQSGRVFDLRFIPNDMKIETTPRDRAESIPDGYAPPNVNPSSLNNSNVKLTWDADDPDRVILKKKNVSKHQLDEENLKAYLAGSSEEDEEQLGEDELKRKKGLLLGGLEEPEADEEDMNMEISFEPGMLEKGEEIMKRKFDKDEQKDETPWEARLRRKQERKAEKRRQRRESLASTGNAEVNEDVDTDDGEEVNGSGDFDSDPFFSVERDLDKAEEEEMNERGNMVKRKEKKKRGNRPTQVAALDEAEAEEQKRKKAELELLVMDDKRVSDGRKDSMRDILAAVESDDDEDRMNRHKRKRKRGKRQSEKDGRKNGDSAKPSAMDTNDERFQNLFNSHLFAMDPTHPKFKQNETTQRILEEKVKRSKKRAKIASAEGNDGKVEVSKTSDGHKQGRKSSSSEAMELVARIKAKAAAKRKEKLQRLAGKG